MPSPISLALVQVSTPAAGRSAGDRRVPGRSASCGGGDRARTGPVCPAGVGGSTGESGRRTAPDIRAQRLGL